MPEINDECMRCFWWDACACDGGKDGNCKYYLQYGANVIVDKFYEDRETDVDRALQPVTEKWIARFELYKHMFDNHEL